MTKNCLTCRRPTPSLDRGCCRACYARHARDIARGKTSWVKLVDTGLALAVKEQHGGKDHSALTDRQQEIYEFIRAKIEANGTPPTIREIGAAFGISSPNGTMAHLTALAKKGYLTLGSNTARGIRLTPRGKGLSIGDSIVVVWGDGRRRTVCPLGVRHDPQAGTFVMDLWDIEADCHVAAVLPQELRLSNGGE